MEEKRNVKLPVMALIAIIFNVFSLIYCAIGYNVFHRDSGMFIVAFLGLVVSCLILAASTTNKTKFLTIIGIIVASSLIAVNFVLAITKYSLLVYHSGDDFTSQILYFSFSLLMLICSIFGLIYFINNLKNGSNKKFAFISYLVLFILVVMYLFTYLTFSICYGISKNSYIQVDTILILASYALISSVPIMMLK